MSSTIITQEMLAENLVKAILQPLWNEYKNDLDAHEKGQDFDLYVWLNTEMLGQIAYKAIGEQYGDLNDAAKEVMG